MNKLEGDTYLTTWECPDTGVEYPLKIYFDYQPFEKVEYQDGYAVYPGCEEEVTITQIDRWSIAHYKKADWRDWLGAKEKEMDDWETEILELIHEEPGDL